MERNLKAINKILEKIEKEQEDFQPISLTFDGIDRYSESLLLYNLKLLIDAGFVDGKLYVSSHVDKKFDINCLTWKGHDLLNILRDENIQNLKKIKDNL